MNTWLGYLKHGLFRKWPEDQIGKGNGYREIKANLKNLRPFVARYRDKAIIGSGIIGGMALLSYPQPLIQRYLIDEVILGRRVKNL